MTLGTDSGTSVATAGLPLRFHGRLAAAGRHSYSTRWSQSGVRAVHSVAVKRSISSAAAATAGTRLELSPPACCEAPAV